MKKTALTLEVVASLSILISFFGSMVYLLHLVLFLLIIFVIVSSFIGEHYTMNRQLFRCVLMSWMSGRIVELSYPIIESSYGQGLMQFMYCVAFICGVVLIFRWIWYWNKISRRDIDGELK